MILQPIAFIVIKLKPTITLYMMQYIRDEINIQQMIIVVLFYVKFLESPSIQRGLL